MCERSHPANSTSSERGHTQHRRLFGASTLLLGRSSPEIRNKPNVATSDSRATKIGERARCRSNRTAGRISICSADEIYGERRYREADAPRTTYVYGRAKPNHPVKIAKLQRTIYGVHSKVALELGMSDEEFRQIFSSALGEAGKKSDAEISSWCADALPILGVHLPLAEKYYSSDS